MCAAWRKKGQRHVTNWDCLKIKDCKTYDLHRKIEMPNGKTIDIKHCNIVVRLFRGSRQE